MNKIVTKKYFKDVLKPKFTEEGKKIALCHGVFDLVHPGHLLHFEQAKAMADVLVVSVTAAKFVRKGPGRPYFDDDMRLKFLAALENIDYVMLSEGYTVDDIIEAVEPDYYVKGSEYADEAADITGKIGAERELVENHGGEMRFTGGQVYSSTQLINNGLAGLSDEVRAYMRNFKRRFAMGDILAWADRASKLKVLVVGEIIIDKYTYCEVQGLMSKDRGYSARLDHSETYLGGAAAVARHLADFASEVTLLSVVGDDEEGRNFVSGMPDKVRLNLLTSSEQPTIVKHRYLEKDSKRESYHKLFAVNNIRENCCLDEKTGQVFNAKLESELSNYDVVFLCDFGHGLIDSEAMKIIQERAKFLVLNCQTNSANFGLNPITKYSRANVFVVDQKELKLAFPDLVTDEKVALRRLAEHLRGSGCLTKGPEGACSVVGEKIEGCPAFTLTVKDTVGAGDAFYAVAGIFAAIGTPTEFCMCMGNIAGALGANIVGNKEAIEKVNVLKYANTLMNV